MPPPLTSNPFFSPDPPIIPVCHALHLPPSLLSHLYTPRDLQKGVILLIAFKDCILRPEVPQNHDQRLLLPTFRIASQIALTMGSYNPSRLSFHSAHVVSPSA